MKCRDYRRYNSKCEICDIKTEVRCEKIFNFEEPTPYIHVKRRDALKFSWNECPTCGKSVGYHPLEPEYKCPRCEQRVLWSHP